MAKLAELPACKAVRVAAFAFMPPHSVPSPASDGGIVRLATPIGYRLQVRIKGPNTGKGWPSLLGS